MRLEMDNITFIAKEPNPDCGGTVVAFERPVGGHYMDCSVCDYEPPVVKYDLVYFTEQGEDSTAMYSNLKSLIKAFNEVRLTADMSSVMAVLRRGTVSRTLIYKDRVGVMKVNEDWTDGFDVR